MTTEVHQITLGDTLTPMGAQLKQKNTSGVLAAVNLTGLTVKFFMTDRSGTIVIEETAATVVDVSTGLVQYDFSDADVVAITAVGAGAYYGWFRVYDGTEYDTYPAQGRRFEIEVLEAK